MIKSVLALSVVASLAIVAPVAMAETYELDPAHTTLGFSIRHLVISSVRGQFKDFSGSVDYDQADPSTAKASAKIAAASISTQNDKRDTHLKSPDFFDVAKFPDVTFESTKAEGQGDQVTLVGNLTIKGVTKEITLPLTVGGPITDPWGNKRIGLEGSTTINRQDFGVSYNSVMDNGGLAVGNDVKLDISIEAVAKKVEPAAAP